MEQRIPTNLMTVSFFCIWGRDGVTPPRFPDEEVRVTIPRLPYLALVSYDDLSEFIQISWDLKCRVRIQS